MSKRGGDSTATHATKVKKRKGVGFRTITVPDSDEEDLIPKTSKEYALVTKTRVGASGKADKVSMTSIPIFEVEQSSYSDPVEENLDDSVNVVKSVVPKVSTKRQKRVNDSVSYLPRSIPLYLLKAP